jgi:hypothetical protein
MLVEKSTAGGQIKERETREHRQHTLTTVLS